MLHKLSLDTNSRHVRGAERQNHQHNDVGRLMEEEEIAWSYLIGNNMNRCMEIYFHLASKYCQNETFVTYVYLTV